MSSSSRPVSSHGPASTSLRPRNRRLISGLDEPPQNELPPTSNPTNLTHSSLNSPLASPFGSRAPSPIPSKHPSRSSSALPHQRRNGAPTPGQPGQYDQIGNDLAASLSGLWGKSWTSLQGLASNVLGNDATEELIKDKSPQRSRRPLQATHSQWGPTLRDESQPGAGSKEERKVLVRERKRQELLMSAGAGLADTARVKRRTSDDFESASTARDDAALDALIYVHHVKRDDTLAGLSIRFNCQLAIIKRANRLWSNDAIQSRKTIVVPVDSCTVRGKRVPSPAPVPAPESRITDSKLTASNALAPSQDPALGHTPQSSISASEPVSPQSTATRTEAEEPPWKHDSWIQLDGQAQPVEIARVSRQDLGFFPRARRKSKSYSDLDTPSASLDLPRPSITVSDATSASYGPHVHRKRGSSGSNHHWTSKLSGPGGVGTLGGKGLSAPGPSTDKFTKAISKHLPNVAPPREAAEDFDDNLSQTSGGGGGGLENVGGAIEGWVRKLAQSAAKAVEQSSRPVGHQQNRRNLGLGPGGPGGDLIELSSAFEIGPDEDDEDEDSTEQQQQRAADESRRGRSLQAGQAGGGGVMPNRTLRPTHDESSKRKGD